MFLTGGPPGLAELLSNYMDELRHTEVNNTQVRLLTTKSAFSSKGLTFIAGGAGAVGHGLSLLQEG